MKKWEIIEVLGEIMMFIPALVFATEVFLGYFDIASISAELAATTFVSILIWCPTGYVVSTWAKTERMDRTKAGKRS
jgi:hypothetical protein